MTLLRRNLIGTAVLGASLSVLAVTRWLPEWSAYRATIVPPTVVEQGDSADVGSQRWQVASVRRLDVAGEAVPPGATRLAVTVERTGAAPDGDPSATLTDGTRRWSPDPLATPAGPGPLQWVFVIPGAAAPTALDITGSDGRILLRLML